MWFSIRRRSYEAGHVFSDSSYKDLAPTEPAMISATSNLKPNHVFQQSARHKKYARILRTVG
jgi:hypothetical protein